MIFDAGLSNKHYGESVMLERLSTWQHICTFIASLCAVRTPKMLYGMSVSPLSQYNVLNLMVLRFYDLESYWCFLHRYLYFMYYVSIMVKNKPFRHDSISICQTLNYSNFIQWAISLISISV